MNPLTWALRTATRLMAPGPDDPNVMEWGERVVARMALVEGREYVIRDGVGIDKALNGRSGIYLRPAMAGMAWFRIGKVSLETLVDPRSLKPPLVTFDDPVAAVHCPRCGALMKVRDCFDDVMGEDPDVARRDLTLICICAAR